MALLRNRPTEHMSRDSRPTSNKSTRQTRIRPAISTDQQYRESPSDRHDEIDFELGFNERFIQSIEELLPEEGDVAGKLAHSAVHQSLERPSNTPGTPIKLERISNSLSDVYDASPSTHTNKAAHLERRQTSRSTAQLTTPASSPDCKCSGLRLTGRHSMVKLEVDRQSNGIHNDVDGICRPPPESSPERFMLSKRSTTRRFPTTPQISPSRCTQRNTDDQDICEDYDSIEGDLITTMLPQISICQQNYGVENAMTPNRKSHAFISKCLATGESQRERSRARYNHFLPPARNRPSLSKITTPTDPLRILSTPPSTPTGLLRGDGILSGNKTCCKLMCLECTPQDLQKEYGLGPPEKRTNTSRFESLSACPSSVSSIGTDDDIPTPSKQLQEVQRLMAERTITSSSDQLSETSPLLRHSNPLTRFGNHSLSSSVTGDMTDTYDDLEVSTFEKTNPCRSIFGRTSKIVSKDDERQTREISQHSNISESNIVANEKGLHERPCRSLRSCSESNKISKETQSLKNQASQKDRSGSDQEEGKDDTEYETEDDTSNIDENGQAESSESGNAGLTLRKLPARAPLGLNSSNQATKRGREQLFDEQPTYFDDGDAGSEDDLVEIDGDTFRSSENRRKKRLKIRSTDAHNRLGFGSPAPKEEQIIEYGEMSSDAQDNETREAPRNDNTKTAYQETPLCDYYMNTYWEHGRASDGRRARDGFTSYLDFKEYCKKNKQPIDDRCILTYKKDLKHYLLCEHHASLRQDLFRVAWNFEHNPGFSFKSSNKDEETRRLQNEAIGNAPSPGSASRGAVAAGADAEMVDMIGELLKGIGTSHAADVAQLTKSKKKLESEVKGLKRRLARIRKR